MSRSGRPRVHPLASRPSRLPRWLIFLGIALVVLFISTAFGGTYLRLFRLQQEAARLEAEKQRLQLQNALLREEIKRLQTPAYVEQLAREQLGLIKPGEIALRIAETTPPPTETENAKQERQGSWLERLFRRRGSP